MKDVQIHWFSILNSLIVVVCLTGKILLQMYLNKFFNKNFIGFLSIIIVRTVRRDIAKYNKDEDIVSKNLFYIFLVGTSNFLIMNIKKNENITCNNIMRYKLNLFMILIGFNLKCYDF